MWCCKKNSFNIEKEIKLSINKLPFPFLKFPKYLRALYTLSFNHGFSPYDQRSKVPIDISEKFIYTNEVLIDDFFFFLKQSTHKVHVFFNESELPCIHNYVLCTCLGLQNQL